MKDQFALCIPVLFWWLIHNGPATLLAAVGSVCSSTPSRRRDARAALALLLKNDTRDRREERE
ncbi:hypothetical protein ACFYUD_02955 [Nocardia tengchongensis]|uniref:hypothetical protein n=1 Tax=Nocardia tengchongensis TaxID=2055889 RepID=UPI003680D33B